MKASPRRYPLLQDKGEIDRALHSGELYKLTTGLNEAYQGFGRYRKVGNTAEVIRAWLTDHQAFARHWHTRFNGVPLEETPQQTREDAVGLLDVLSDELGGYVVCCSRYQGTSLKPIGITLPTLNRRGTICVNLAAAERSPKPTREPPDTILLLMRERPSQEERNVLPCLAEKEEVVVRPIKLITDCYAAYVAEPTNVGIVGAFALTALERMIIAPLLACQNIRQEEIWARKQPFREHPKPGLLQEKMRQEPRLLIMAGPHESIKANTFSSLTTRGSS